MTADHLGPWQEGIWSEWASENSIRLPNITPLEARSALTPHKVYSRVEVGDLKDGLSLTIRDHINKFGEVPIWAKAFIKRDPSNILTKRRSKRLTGYIVNHSRSDRFYMDKIFNVFKKGGYILDLKSDANKKTLRKKIWFIEKEIVTMVMTS